jgi:hypothetical protein
MKLFKIEGLYVFLIKPIPVIALVAILISSCSMEKLYTMQQSRKVYPFEQVNFHELVQRYMSKENSSIGTIEGIYSVSIVVTKKGIYVVCGEGKDY